MCQIRPHNEGLTKSQTHCVRGTCVKYKSCILLMHDGSPLKPGKSSWPSLVLLVMVSHMPNRASLRSEKGPLKEKRKDH